MTIRPALVLLATLLTAGEPTRAWTCEEQWLVDHTARMMLRWSVPAGTEPSIAIKPAKESGGYLVHLGGTSSQKVTVSVADGQWSVAGFLPLAKALLPGDAPAAPPKDAEQRLAERLLAPTTPLLLAEDARLSPALDEQRRDPGLHEQAALLLACMAYRESAGLLDDSRLELCAATAQLALAQAMRPEPGICGRIATSLIDAITGRATAVQAAVATWPATAPWPAWKRAVTLRASLDWKKHGIAANATVVERLAQARSLSLHLRCGGCAHWIEQQKGMVDMPDWGRLVCEGGIDVENGHRYARGGLELDIAEIGQVWNHFHPDTAFADAQLVPALSAQPSSTAPPRILGEARWALFLSRHLGHRLLGIHEHAARQWGVAEEAATVRALCAGPLARIPLMPAIRGLIAEDPDRVAQARRAIEQSTRRPELLGTWVWWSLARDAALWKSVGGSLSAAATWYADIAPRGTMYQAAARVDLLGTALAQPAERMESLLALGRREPCLLGRIADLRWPGAKKEKLAKLKELFGDDAAIDLDLAKRLAEEGSSDERMQALERLAALDPDCWYEVYQAHQRANREDAAMQALEHLFTDGRNRVRVANCTDPLIRWHERNQRLARATEIAAHNYEVFSYRGIASKAGLDERQHDLDAAEACWKALLERYEDEKPLLRFWQRTAKGRPASASALAARIALAFPAGQKKVGVSDCVGAPARGVEVTSECPLSLKHGVRTGTIIVACDGIACDNQAQFMLQRDLTDGPLRVIVWDGKAYREVSADLGEDRRFGVNLGDHPRPNRAP